MHYNGFFLILNCIGHILMYKIFLKIQPGQLSLLGLIFLQKILQNDFLKEIRWLDIYSIFNLYHLLIRDKYIYIYTLYRLIE